MGYKRLTIQDLKNTWDMAEALGQRETGKQLGIHQYGVQHRLRAYAQLTGWEGPLPGYTEQHSNKLAEALGDASSNEDRLWGSVKASHEEIDRRLSRLEAKLNRLLAMADRREVRIVVLDHRRLADGGKTRRHQIKEAKT